MPWRKLKALLGSALSERKRVRYLRKARSHAVLQELAEFVAVMLNHFREHGDWRHTWERIYFVQVDFVVLR